MAVEIKELIVKAVVSADTVASKSENTMENDFGNSTKDVEETDLDSDTEKIDKAELVKACVKEVLKILRKSRER